MALSHASQRLVAALDVPDGAAALDLARRIAPYVGCLKIGLELFIAEGPALVRKLASHSPIFLDLKLADIPATVERATRSAANLGVRFLTVHVDPGGRALRAAVDAADQRLEVLAVTVLTSISQADLDAERSAQLSALVAHRARVALESGCAGVVCAAQEVELVRTLTDGALKIVTPGIRPAGHAHGDQRRVMTPTQAITAGADLLVVGRPIRDASQPDVAARAIAEEISLALAR